MDYYWYDFVGNLGVALIVLAFYWLQVQKITSEQPLYSWLNLVGALCITVSLMYDFNLSSFIIEMFWIAISLIGLVRYFIRTRKLKQNRS